MSTYSHGDAHYLSDEQMTALLGPIKPFRVGKDGKGFSHVEAYDIRAHLNRLFGIARWDADLESCDLVFETESQKRDKKGQLVSTSDGEPVMVWTACYRSVMRVSVRAADGTHLATYSDVATGDATNMPSRADAHDMACKTSASQALKRAAVNLGDQFGLSLYNKGQLAPSVRLTLVGMPPADGVAGAVVDAHITTPLAPENGEPESPQREVSSQPVPPVPAVAPVAAPVAVVEQVPPPAADPTPVDDELTVEAARTQIAELSPQAAAGARLLNGENIDEAILNGHLPAEENAAVEALTEAFGELAPVAEPAPAAVADPFDWCLEQIGQARKVQPELAIPMLHKVMEVAVRKQLRGRRMEGGTETLGAHLTGLMQRAGDAVAKRKAEAAAHAPSDF